MRAAILGTGIMGTGMAHSLRREGHDVTVWNRSADKASAVGQGAAVADSPAEAVRNADVVFTMLSDADAVEEVANQFLEVIGTGVWCQSSTVGVNGTQRLADLAAKHQVAYVECPVSGTKQPAEDGKLGVLAAGAPELEARVMPALDAISARVVWLGDDPVQASVAKLMINNWMLSATAALAETISLGEAYGIDPHQFLDALTIGPLNMAFAQTKGAMMAKRDYPTSFPLVHAAKDARLVSDAAGAKNLSLSVNAGVAALYTKAGESHGNEDVAAVMEGVTALPTVV